MLSITEILLNKLALINHKKKFEESFYYIIAYISNKEFLYMKISEELIQYILHKNLLCNNNTFIWEYFIEMYYKGYSEKILKFFFDNELYYQIEYTIFNRFKISLYNLNKNDINLFFNSLVQYKDIDLIDMFIHVMYKNNISYGDFIHIKILLQHIINTNNFIFFTKFYDIIKDKIKNKEKRGFINNFLNNNNMFLIKHIFTNIIINNTEMYEYCNNLELVSDKNKSIQLTRWYNRKNYIIFLSGYLKNKPDYTKIFTDNDISKYICYYL